MKLAVVTRDISVFRFVRSCFPEDCQFARIDQSAAMAPVLSNNEFCGLLLDANLSQDAQSAFPDLTSRRVPLIVFRAPREPHFMSRSLEASADEIVLLPLDASELYLRTLHALKRFKCEACEHHDHEVAFANYRLDRRAETVTICGGSIDAPHSTVRLTSREFAILWALSVAPGNYLSRQQIASDLWASDEDIVGRTLEQHIYKVRKKMKMTGETGVRIRAIYGRGYQLDQISHSLAAD